MTLFEAAAERERAMARLMSNPKNAVFLNTCRSMAREICGRRGEVCIDDVRELLAQRGYEIPKDARVFGPVFRSKEFVPVRKIDSTRPERIARAGRGASGIWIYKLRSAA